MVHSDSRPLVTLDIFSSDTFIITVTLRVFFGVAVHLAVVSYLSSGDRDTIRSRAAHARPASPETRPEARKDLGTSFAAHRFSWVHPIRFMSYLHLAAN